MTIDTGLLDSFPAMSAIEAFHTLISENEAMIQLLSSSSTYIKVHNEPDFALAANTVDNDLKRAKAALRDIWYVGAEDSRSTRRYQGLIMAKPSLLSAAESVNRAKDQLRASIDLLKGEKASLVGDFKAHISQHYKTRKRLAPLGLGRLNLKACYRHLPILDTVPTRVGYSAQFEGKSIRRISVEEAMNKLVDLNRSIPEHIQIQLDKLSQLPPNYPLVQVSRQAPIIKANLVFKAKRESDQAEVRLTRKPPLPFFVPEGQIPVIKFADLQQNRSPRLERMDKKIEDKPFLPSIRVYRYAVEDRTDGE